MQARYRDGTSLHVHQCGDRYFCLAGMQDLSDRVSKKLVLLTTLECICINRQRVFENEALRRKFGPLHLKVGCNVRNNYIVKSFTNFQQILC